MFKEIIPFLILITMFIITKKFGCSIYGKSKKIKSYINVFENKDKKIMLTVNIKKMGLFEEEKTYKLKYIKIKNNIEEIKSYFDIVLKDEEYLLTEIKSEKFLDFSKKATIYLRNSVPAFDRLPIKFLPEMEVKSIVKEMLELDIVEFENKHFKTWNEKMVYNRFLKELDREKTL